jgi:hypothetical protein
VLVFRCDACGAEGEPTYKGANFGEDVFPALPEGWIETQAREYCTSCLPGDYRLHGPHRERDLTKPHPYMTGIARTMVEVAYRDFVHPSKAIALESGKAGDVIRFKLIKGEGS